MNGTFAICPDCAGKYAVVSGDLFHCEGCEGGERDLATVDIYLEWNERWTVRDGFLFVYTIEGE